MRIFFTLLLALASMLPCPESHAQVIGTRAEEWQVSSWINSSPLALNDLAGKVVLVRWWTAPSCPYCKASSSAINEWHSRYQDQGLVVIGFYHHKSSAPLKPDDVKSYAETLGFDFPVAVDDDWTTLKRWWLSRNPDAKWTSVSFLIDRNGIIRLVHPGGKYVKGDPDFTRIEAEIEKLLREKKQDMIIREQP